MLVTGSSGISSGEKFDAFVGLYRTEIKVNKVDAILEGEHFIVRKDFAKPNDVCVVDLSLADTISVSKEGILQRVMLRRENSIVGIGYIKTWRE